MTILGRYEKPGMMQLTICGLPSPQWFEGLVSGAIARGQGGLTQGQMMWLRTHQENDHQAWVNPDLFDPEDTGEL
jgi:hypothetical protein